MTFELGGVPSRMVCLEKAVDLIGLVVMLSGLFLTGYALTTAFVPGGEIDETLLPIGMALFMAAMAIGGLSIKIKDARRKG